MENSLGVRVVERRCDRGEPADREPGGNGPRDAALERAARHERHDEVGNVGAVDRRGSIVEDGEDVRVLEAGDEAGLSQEALAEG